MVVGSVTRGTTNANRLRRCDRWLTAWPGIRRMTPLHAVDLGYGAHATTTIEMADRLLKVRPDVHVWGIEIDPERVSVARQELHARVDLADTVTFIHGGFEIPLPGDLTATVIRAFNVLRQYDESEVAPAWQTMVNRLAPGGLLIDGTCDEIGRVSTWVAIDAEGPQTLTLSLRLGGLDAPSIAAERLPKSLIHHNVPGQPVHRLFQDLDRAWRRNAGLATFGPVQRWLSTVTSLRDEGWPVLDGRTRWRLGELTVPYSLVAP